MVKQQNLPLTVITVKCYSTMFRAVFLIEVFFKAEELKAYQELKVEFSQKTDEWSQKELNFETEISTINKYAKTHIEENSTLKRAMLEVEKQVCTLKRSLLTIK